MKPQKTRASLKAKDVWQFRLYVAGNTPRVAATLANLKHLCRQHMAADYHLQVIDVLKQPALVKTDQIVAIPTLVRTFPEPVRQVLGDLSNLQRALVALDLCPAQKP